MKILSQRPIYYTLALIITLFAVSHSSHIHHHKQRILTEKPPTASNGDTLTCNQEIMTSYGFQGLPTPSKKMHQFCPSVMNNCCSEDDVELSMKLWNSDSMRKIEAYYETYLYSLKYLLGFAYEVDLLSEKLLDSERSSCRKAAKEFKTLNINREIAKEIFKAFVESLEKMAEARRGFYCVLCDATTQSQLKDFWAIKNVFYQDRVYFNQQFCVDLVEHTIRGAYYEVFYLKKYLELSTMLMSCQMGKSDIDELEYEVPYWNQQQIKNCYYFKNKYFFFFCENYCEKFQLTKANPNFDGNLEELHKFVKFFTDHRENAFYSPSDNFLMGFLGSKEEYLRENFREFMTNEENKVFFKAATRQVVLDEFKTDVLVEGGFNPLDSVKGSLYPINLAGVGVLKVGFLILVALWFK